MGRWRLGGAVRCEHHFTGALKSQAAESGGSKPHGREPDARFRMRAVPPMPRLQVSIVPRTASQRATEDAALSSCLQLLWSEALTCARGITHAMRSNVLQVRIQGLPAQALYGELMWCLVEVTNVGTEPAASLRLAASHPAFFGT